MTDDRFADLHVFPRSNDPLPTATPFPGWESLGRVFERATGCRLPSGEDSPAGEAGSAEARGTAGARGSAAAELAEAVGRLVRERGAALEALRRREAELATAIPVVLERDGSEQLVRRLEAVLRDAARSMSCFAGAVYMLDDATSQLKLRAGWGLPTERFLEAARPLRGAISDLEAMLGHIVLLDDTSKLPHWRSPEQAAAAACVPLSSASTPLGTLWFFAEEPRGFSENDGRLLEIVAGRVVAELEREAVSRERALAHHVETQLGRARQWQDDRLPRVAPPLPGWEWAGWSAQSERLGGDFHGWNMLPDESLAVCLGHARGGMLEAALTAASLQGSLTMCLRQTGFERGAAPILGTLNQALWTHSSGDQRASLACAVVEPRSGRLRFASAGETGAAVIGANGPVHLPPRRDFLGERLETTFPETGLTLAGGDLLLLYSEGVTRVENHRGEPLAAAELTDLLQEHRGLSARQLVDHARLLLQAEERHWTSRDCTIVVLRRTEES